MHFVFIPYGVRSEVEVLLRCMESQMHQFPIWKGKKKKFIHVQGTIRILPFGVYEYVFPRENMDVLLHTLMPTGPARYDVGKLRTTILRKILKVEKMPEWYKETPKNKRQKFLWMKQNVNIIPIGIRDDGDTKTKNNEYENWEHEAL